MDRDRNSAGLSRKKLSNGSASNGYTIFNDSLPFELQSCIRHRYVLCTLVCSGLALVYAMRVNLSVTIIAMVGSKGRNASAVDNATCPISGDISSNHTEGEFDWNQKLEASVLNSFFYGYISTQIIGGIMADKMSIKWVFGYGVFLTSVLTILTSWVARWSVYALILLRVLEGATEGVTFPCVYCLVARWAPVSERTTMLNLALIGTNVGTVITMPIAAALTQSPLGWPAAFYIPGCLGLVWSLAWWICASSQPENHRWISDEERQYIMGSRGTTDARSRRIPWMNILTSRPVWLFALSRFCLSLTFYVFLTEMPTFVDNIFHISMTSNGGLNASFYIFYAVVAFASGFTSDRLIKSKVMSRTNVRKTFECSCFLITGSMLILVAQLGCHWKAVAVVLCLASASMALSGGGNAGLALDLAPNFAGSVMGLGNMVGNCAGIVAPLLVGFMTDKNVSLSAWNNVFYVTAAVSFIGAVVFGLFGTAEEQPWSQLKEDEDGIISEEQ